jgi:hypothetical protein
MAMSSLDTVIQDLVIANRILAKVDVVDAYGHVSVRHPENPSHFLISRLIIGRQGWGTIANVRSCLLLRRDGSKSHLRDLCRLIYADGRWLERSPAFGEENRCRTLQLCGSPGNRAC